MFLVVGLIAGALIVAAIVFCIKVCNASSAWEEFNKQNRQKLIELAKKVHNGDPNAGRELETELREIKRKLQSFGYTRHDMLNAYLEAMFAYKDRKIISEAQEIRRHELWCRNEVVNLKKLLADMGEDFSLQENRRLWSKLMKALEDEQMRRLFFEATDFDIEATQAKVQAAVDSQYSVLCGIYTDNRLAYSKLVELFTEVNGSWGLKRFGITALDYPPNWLDRVALCVNNPNLADFAVLPDPKDIPTGRCRLRAAKALRDDDYTEAKIVLAYCNYTYAVGGRIRDEVGDVLTAELAKLIARHDKRRASQAVE